jgi:hypothetical protein
MDVEALKDVFRLARLAALASNNSEKVCEINDFRNETIAALTTLQSREATLISALEHCEIIVLEQRCERGTPWDLACVTCAAKVREHINKALATSEKEQ